MNTKRTHIKQARLMLITLALLMAANPFQPLLADGLRSSVSSTQIGFGESFDLTLSMDSASATTAPDLAPLQKNFRILGTGQNSQINIINGRRTESFSWVVTLMPLEKGQLTIPAIRAGKSISQPLAIEVVDPAELPAGSPATGEFSLDVTAEPGAHYVLEEIPLTVRIQGEGIIRQASLEEPENKDFVLTQSGEDQVSRSTRNGRQITVIERHYLLKPQKSGSLTFPPLTLQAIVEDPAAARSSIFSDPGFANDMLQMPFNSSLFADVFNSGREIAVQSQPLQLEVKPRPTGDAVWFLPAKQVELSAEWTPAKPEFRVGEAVTRKIRLWALGASVEQLPDIPITHIDGAQRYLNNSNSYATDTAEGTASVREFDVSVVPNQAGKITLPEITVKWWDTTADKERVATLAAQTIEVAPGTGSNAGRTRTQTAVETLNESPVADTGPTPAPVAESPSIQHKSTYILSILLAVILLALAAFAIRRKGNPTANKGNESGSGDDAVIDPDQQERAVIQACKANDLRRAYSALNSWMLSGTKYPDAVSHKFRSELAEMEKQLFAGGSETTWQGKRMLELFIKEKAAQKASGRGGSHQNTIPALYPN